MIRLCSVPLSGRPTVKSKSSAGWIVIGNTWVGSALPLRTSGSTVTRPPLSRPNAPGRSSEERISLSPAGAATPKP
jgi:hypothetical protein